jgi:uncharacterized protein YdiU (UPF0061 family)
MSTPAALPADPPAGAPGSPPPFDPAHLRWINRFAALGPRFQTFLPAQPLPEPAWAATSAAAAQWLGWPADWWQAPHALAVFSGHATWPGMATSATVYSGHQFGVWAGQLGDGRALLLGEVQTGEQTPGPSPGSAEVQLKGSGLTPYSRMGDGRAVLRSSVREFLCSEAMHALGIPTTRALCLTASPLPVRRETIETAAMVTRLAPSFIRFGHFEHFAHHNQHAALRELADFVIDAHYPQCRSAAQPHAALLREVALRTADLLAQWQAVGFCHGVMNTDNMSILGLTIDYGPFGFMDAFDPGHVCNHSDERGRYAYANQPAVAFWNLAALAQAVLPLLADGEHQGEGQGQEAAVELALASIEPFKQAFPQAVEQRMRAKLGLATAQPGDKELIDGLQQLMAAGRCDFSITFRRLAGFSTAPGAEGQPAHAAVRDLFIDRPAFDAWAARYAARLRAEGSDDAARAAAMNRVNPRYVLRNHLAEVAIQQARGGDFTEIDRLLKVLQRPYDEQPEHAAYAAFPPDWAQGLEVSCSS